MNNFKWPLSYKYTYLGLAPLNYVILSEKAMLPCRATVWFLLRRGNHRWLSHWFLWSLLRQGDQFCLRHCLTSMTFDQKMEAVFAESLLLDFYDFWSDEGTSAVWFTAWFLFYVTSHTLHKHMRSQTNSTWCVLQRQRKHIVILFSD